MMTNPLPGPRDLTLLPWVHRALHALIGAVLGWLYFFTFAVVLPLAGALSLIWVGVPVLVALMLFWRTMGGVERALINRLLGGNIPKPPSLRELNGNRWAQLRMLFAHNGTWRAITFLAMRTVHGMIASIGLLFGAVLSIGMMLVPFLGGSLSIGSWHSKAGVSSWWTIPLGLVCGVLTFFAAGLWAIPVERIGRLLLGPSQSDALRAANTERLELTAKNQLAADLHDSVGHAMSSVVVQAGAARAVFDSDPTFARRALGDIEEAARGALVELDQMLGVLRHGETSRRAPQPTLRDLDALLTATRKTGLVITEERTGDLANLSEPISALAYRVVQEGLTNVLRHTALAPTRVTLARDDGALRIGVVNVLAPRPRRADNDDDEGEDAAREGWGLRGLSERVKALGGAMKSGATADGGFVVDVSLPLPPSAALGDHAKATA